MKLKCKRCKNEWEYQGIRKPGKYPQYTSCPKCRTSVKIEEEKKYDNLRNKEQMKIVNSQRRKK